MPETIDVNVPVTNPELRRMIDGSVSLRGDVEKYREQMEKIFENAAMNAHFLAVVRMDPETVGTGETVLKKDTKVSFEILADADGNRFLPVFTDWEALLKWKKKPNVRAFIVTFDDICAMAEKSAFGMVINPYSGDIMASCEMLRHMKETKDMRLAGHSEVTVKKGTAVRLGEPAEYPTAMTEAIRKKAKKIKCIDAIYLKLKMQDDELSYLLVVDFRGDRREVFDQIADAARPYLPKGMYIDMVPFDVDFGRKAADNEPFYKKEKKWWQIFQ